MLREHPRSFRAPLVPDPGLHVYGWIGLEDDGLGAGDVRVPQLPSHADAPELGHSQVRRDVTRTAEGSAMAAASYWPSWSGLHRFYGCNSSAAKSRPHHANHQGLPRCLSRLPWAAYCRCSSSGLCRPLLLQLHTMLVSAVQGQHHTAATLWLQKHWIVCG